MTSSMDTAGALPSHADAVVIGAGIVGCATAAAIAARGHSVILIEKEHGPAREGSGRAQGSLSQGDVEPD